MIVEGKRKAEWFLGRKLDPQKYKGKKYYVLSETGERLFGGYKTKKEAKKRLGQVEFFKRRGNPGSPDITSRSYTEDGKTFRLFETEGGRLLVWENSPYAQGAHSVYDFVVDESLRGQGIGSRMVDALLEQYPDHEISAQVSSLPSLKVFYKKGFSDGESKNFAELKKEWEQWGGSLNVRRTPNPRRGRGRRHKDRLPGGLADKYSPSDFDPRALRKGTKVEMEHTNDRRIAREIAMDHLAEHPDYYEALEKMERELEENPTPTDQKLYKKVVREAKKKFDVWPSIYASSWVVQEYKRRGGAYENPSGLQKWYDEKWVDLGRSIDKNGRVKKWVQCGRPDADEGAYPKCVPLAKAKKMTPKQRLSAVRRKRRAEKSAKDKKGRAPVMVSTFKEDNPSGLAKDVKKMFKIAEAQGCVIIKGRKHYKVRCPQGRQFTVAASPSDKRALKNIRRDFRHAGIELNPRKLRKNPEVFPVGAEFKTGANTWVVEKAFWGLPDRKKFGYEAPAYLKETYAVELSGGPKPRYHVLVSFESPDDAMVQIFRPDILGSGSKTYSSYPKGGYHLIDVLDIQVEPTRKATVQRAVEVADRYLDSHIAEEGYRRMNPRKVLYIKPNKAAVKAAKRGLDAREKAPKSKKGGLDAMQAKAEGVGSGVLRARDIIAGKRVNAYQVKAFFDRHRGNYLKAKDKRLKPEESRAIQAWLIWGGDPLYKQATAAVEKDRKKRKGNPGSLPIPLANPKKFWDKEHNWKQVLINKGGKRKTRKQILDYYLKNEKKIWPFLKGQTVLVIFGRGRNDFVLRRKGPDGKYIKLTKLKGIDDPNSFEYWIHRRAIEFHPVITSKTTGLVWVDIDPYKKARSKSMAKMQRDIRKAIPLMKRMLKDEFGVQKSYVWRSGKSDGGWHIEGNLPRKMNVDKLRKKLRKSLDEYFAEDPTFTTGIAKPGQVRLDTTLTKTLGSLRAPFSYTVDGGQKLPVDVPGMAKPKSKYRKTAKRNVELTEEEYAEAKELIEERQQPPFNPIGYGGNRMVYLIEVEGREPFALKADQGFRGTRLQTMDEVQNIQTIDNPLLPEIYDHDEKNYRWVEMELLDALEDDAESRKRFEQISGMDWKDFDVSVWGLSQAPSEKDIEEVQARLVKNKRAQVFFGMIADLWDEGLSPREMSILPNWGVTEDGRLKYLDVGA